MTKYVISGYIGFDNFGDEAIAAVLINHLKSQNAEKITVLSLNPEKTSRLYGADSVKFLDFLKPILETDVLISGGGSLLQDITSLRSLLYYLCVIMTAIAFNKKVFIFAQGFTPFRTKVGKLLTLFVLKKCQKITVRDSFSQKFLKDNGIDSELVSDPVFGIEIPKIEKHCGIGVQLRSFKNLNDDFLNSLADGITQKFKNQTIKLISLHDVYDLAVIEKFAGMLSSRGCVTEILKDLTVPEAVEELSKLEYLIGMRFHACLTAAKSGVKVLGINYDIKVKTLAEMVGFPLINMYGCEVESGINSLMDTNTSKYNLPEFKFPNIIL